MTEPAPPCACPNPPLHAAACPATADLRLPAAGCDAEPELEPLVIPLDAARTLHTVLGACLGDPAPPDPLAPFRALADRYARHAAEQDRNAAVLDQRLNDTRNQPAPGAAVTGDDRRALYAAVLREHGIDHIGLLETNEDHECCADAVLAVRDEELEQLRAAVARVRAIHRPVDTMAGVVCEGCMNCDPYESLPWPCRTIEALDQPTKDPS